MVNLKKIKDIAQKQGVTLAAVAEAAELTPTGLSLIIRENTTKVGTLEKIAEFLGVPISEFFNDEEYNGRPRTAEHTASGPGMNLSVNSDQTITRTLDILEAQLKVKDEQIGGLIKALNK